MKIAALEGQQKELVAGLEDPAAYEAGGNAVGSTANFPPWPTISLD